MLQKRDRHDERHEARAVLLDDLDHLGAIGGIDELAHVTEEMLHHVHVLLAGRAALERRHELGDVLAGERVHGWFSRLRHQLAHAPVGGLVVGEDQKLVLGVKVHELSR